MTAPRTVTVGGAAVPEQAMYALFARFVALSLGAPDAADSTVPTLTTGEGAPTSSYPDGSVYLRRDGAADTTLYMRVSGAWVAIEGAGGATTITDLTVTGNTVLGDATSDTITATARFASALVPSTDDARDLGSASLQWRDLYIDGTANIDALVADTADIDAGTIDGAVIGGVTPAAITGTTITGTSVVTDTVAEQTSAAGVTVDGCLIKDGRAANLAAAALFTSTEQTGTGSSQDIAHGFGSVPTMAWFWFTELPSGLGSGAVITPGAHDATDLKVTVTSGVKYIACAIR